MRTLLALLALCLTSPIAHAQYFYSYPETTFVSPCPGGVCPTTKPNISVTQPQTIGSVITTTVPSNQVISNQVTYSTLPSSAVIYSSPSVSPPTYSVPNSISTANQIVQNYPSGRWSHPGSIESHLLGSNHNVPSSVIRSMSRSQLEQLHSSLHQSNRPQYSSHASRVTSQPRTGNYYYYNSNGCLVDARTGRVVSCPNRRR